MASPAVAATNSGTEHFLGMSTSTAANPKNPVAASGPIHALGFDKVLSNTKDRYSFPKGSLTVVHKAKHDTETSDPKTCLFHTYEMGTYTIASGTGAYAHVHGHGTYTVSIYAVGCKQNKPPITFSFILKASGPLSY